MHTAVVWMSHSWSIRKSPIDNQRSSIGTKTLACLTLFYSGTCENVKVRSQLSRPFAQQQRKISSCLLLMLHMSRLGRISLLLLYKQDQLVVIRSQHGVVGTSQVRSPLGCRTNKCQLEVWQHSSHYCFLALVFSTSIAHTSCSIEYQPRRHCDDPITQPTSSYPTAAKTAIIQRHCKSKHDSVLWTEGRISKIDLQSLPFCRTSKRKKLCHEVLVLAIR